MPVISNRGLKIDFTDDGDGEAVVLIHATGGNRQWKRLIQELKDRFRVLAPNLYGYGETTPWREDGTQTLADHANLIEAVCDSVSGPIRLVGHSFGGSVALKVAANLGDRVSHLALFEPNPWCLLQHDGRTEAFAEAMAMHDDAKSLGKQGSWMALAERFAEYFSGDGSWAQMPAERRTAFARLLLPNYYEWDCFYSDATPVETYSKLRAKTLLMHSANTRLALREIAEVFHSACPHWTFVTLPDGGHMAPLTRPDLVNPIVKRFLD